MFNRSDVTSKLFKFFVSISLYKFDNTEHQNHFTSRLVIVDGRYSSIEITTIEAMLISNPLLQSVPIGQEINDCDDFALQVKSSITSLVRQRAVQQHATLFPPAVGILLTPRHALNIIICHQDNDPTNFGVFLLDAMKPGKGLISSPKEAKELMLQPEISLIYI
tara:strand:+ start:804 stop:1295 length:492 start_codon:yes stop_codon:yes gene_type:complete